MALPKSEKCLNAQDELRRLREENARRAFSSGQTGTI
jgi:hypothetical protein